MKQSAIVAIVSLFIVGVLILPAWQKDRTAGVQRAETSGDVVLLPDATIHNEESLLQGLTLVQDDADSADEGLFGELDVRLVPTDEGFQLQLNEEQYPQVIGTASAPERVVHGVIRYSYEDDDGGQGGVRLDAVVVEPDTQSFKIYPLYELQTEHHNNSSLFTIMDERHVLFIRPVLEREVFVYDLARLDIETGEISVLSPHIWETDRQDNRTAADFFISAHMGQGSDPSSGKLLLLSSFKGRVWLIDTESGEVQFSSGTEYPAYGDPGSKPPRELIFPSPDLQRMVYQAVDQQQIEVGNHFRLDDLIQGQLLTLFGIEEEFELMNPGIVWSDTSEMFFQEYADKDNYTGMGFDNSNMIFAEGIRFFDREGVRIGDLVVPSGSDQRVNAFGWQEGMLWVEYYNPPQSVDSKWAKGDISYKLYDVRSDKLTGFDKTNDLGKLESPVVIRRHNGLTYGSAPFLLADLKNKLVWEPPAGARSLYPDGESDSDGQLYMVLYSEDAAHIQRWDAGKRSWGWVGSGPGNDEPYMYNNHWLIYSRFHEYRIDYIPMAAEVERNDDGLPVLIGTFAEDRKGGDWWEDSEYKKLGKADARSSSVRAEGRARYGTIRLQAEPGEWMKKNGGQYQFFGAYQVVFTDRSGQKKTLDTLSDFALLQEEPASRMTVYEFDGYDVLLLQPNSYRFSKGFDGNVKDILAYAITKQGEAFPLTFEFASRTGLERTSAISINDLASIRRDEDRLIVQSTLDDRRYELALKPNPETRTLIVADAADRSAEYRQLQQITERYANRLEQALGLKDSYLPEGAMDEDQLRALFTEQAWSNPGFQYLRKSFAQSEEAGYPSRAFAWNPIDAEWIRPDTIQVTFTLNLWYAIGFAAHLDATMKLVDGVWMFHDFGTLTMEKMEDSKEMSDYNGLLMEDPLEAD